jgi:glycosyltransferase involved in cell wall biosynthesis
LYGGNLGKPQGIDFLIRVIESNVRREDLFFVVVGSGTEFPRMRSWFDRERPGRALLLEGLPKNDYDRLVPACDVGMIFLDPRFTIPNFPSRLLSYLECRMPVLAATDTATDMGRIMEQGGFGLWSKSGDLEGINRNIQALAGDPQRRLSMGEAGHKYLLDNYTVEHSYRTIVDGMGLLS